MAGDNIPRLKGEPKYKDAPRFALIYQYEGKFKSLYDDYLKDAVRAFAAKYKSIIIKEEKKK